MYECKLGGDKEISPVCWYTWAYSGVLFSEIEFRQACPGMFGHARACSGMFGHVQFQTFQVFLEKKCQKIGNFFCKNAGFWAPRCKFKGFWSSFFQNFLLAEGSPGGGRWPRTVVRDRNFLPAPPGDLGGCGGHEIWQKQQSRSDFYSFFERFRCFQVFFVWKKIVKFCKIIL